MIVVYNKKVPLYSLELFKKVLSAFNTPNLDYMNRLYSCILFNLACQL